SNTAAPPRLGRCHGYCTDCPDPAQPCPAQRDRKDQRTGSGAQLLATFAQGRYALLLTAKRHRLPRIILGRPLTRSLKTGFYLKCRPCLYSGTGSCSRESTFQYDQADRPATKTGKATRRAALDHWQS